MVERKMTFINFVEWIRNNPKERDAIIAIAIGSALIGFALGCYIYDSEVTRILALASETGRAMMWRDNLYYVSTINQTVVNQTWLIP